MRVLHLPDSACARALVHARKSDVHMRKKMPKVKVSLRCVSEHDLISEVGMYEHTHLT